MLISSILTCFCLDVSAYRFMIVELHTHLPSPTRPLNASLLNSSKENHFFRIYIRRNDFFSVRGKTIRPLRSRDAARHVSTMLCVAWTSPPRVAPDGFKQLPRHTKSYHIITKGHDNAVKGYDNAVKGHDNAAKGHDNAVKGHDNAVKGHDNAAKGHDNAVKGHDNAVKGHDNASKGHDNAVKGHDNAVKGHDNTSKGYDKTEISSDKIIHKN